MDTRFLESFVAVVEAGSFAEAARRTNVTPATLAVRMTALERELGIKLVARAGRNIKPTESGNAVYDQIVLALRSVRDLSSIAQMIHAVGQLKLGCISTALTGIMPVMVKAASDAHPRLDVHVSPGSSADLYRRIVEGELDAAIVVQPPFETSKSLEWHELAQEPLVLLLQKESLLRDPGEIFSRYPLIRYDRNQWGGRLADLYLKQNGYSPRQSLELDALESIAVLVDIGVGVSLVPDWHGPWPRGLALTKILVGGTEHARRVGMLWLKTNRRTHLLRAFLDASSGLIGNTDDHGGLQERSRPKLEA